MSTESEILNEIAQVSKDLAAFKQAYDAIAGRIAELESNVERHDTFVTWAGTQAALNVLVMCIVRCEGLLEDYRCHVEHRNHQLH